MASTRTRLTFWLIALLSACAPYQASAADVRLRYAHTATLLPDRNILVAGGIDTAGNPTFTAFLMLEDRNQRQNVPSMNVTRASHTATLLPTGEVLIVGGRAGATVRNTAEVYNPEHACWHPIMAMAEAAGRYNHTATLLSDGTVLICGGENIAGAALASCEKFTPNNPPAACGAAPGSFAAAPNSLQQARSGHTAVMISGGRVLFAGGFNPTAVPPYLNTVEKYSPINGAFQSAHPLNQARAFHTATVLSDGKVFLAGGFNNRNKEESLGFVESTEIYDPIGDSMVYAQPMHVRRMGHTATLSANGQVDVYGGLGNMTTSYIEGLTVNLIAGSSVTGTYSDPPGLATTTISAGFLTLELEFDVSEPATGVILDGDIFFSTPNVKFTNGELRLNPGNPNNRNGLKASLVGVQVGTIEKPGHVKAQFNIALPSGSGTITFEKNQDVTIKDSTLRAGSQITFAPAFSVPGVSGDQSDITGGDLYANITLTGLPREFLNATMITASLRLSGGGPIEIRQGGDPAANISITDALATGLTGTLSLDPDEKTQITFSNAHFSSLAGTVKLTTSAAVPITSPILSATLANRGFASLQGKLSYVVDRIDLSGKGFSVGLSTVVIRQMLFSDLESYYPKKSCGATNVWEYTAYSLGGHRMNHTATLSSRGDIRIIGGRTCFGLQCPLLDSSAPTFPVLPHMKDPWSELSSKLANKHGNHTATTLPDGRILIAGGTNGPNVIRSAEIFDPAAETVQATGSMSEVRSLHTASLLPNGKVLVAGGYSTNSESTGAIRGVELYYPESNTWVADQPMIYSRSLHTAVTLHDGNVMVIGGYADSQYLSTVEVYYSTAGAWREVAALPEARALHTATLLQDGRILVVGGQSATGVLGTTRLYDPRTGAWSAGAPLLGTSDWPAGAMLHSHTASLLLDGRVLVAGGNDGAWETDLSQIYDPKTNSWMAAGFLTTKRHNHTATLLPNGTVLINGGAQAIANNGKPIAGVELFNVADSSWSSNAPLSAPRAYHTTTLARNGMLYNIGGYDGMNTYYDSLEKIHYAGTPDSLSASYPPSLRLASMTLTDLAVFGRGDYLTAIGQRFQGNTEASGGGAAGANSDHRHPRLILQAVDGSGGGASQGNSGFILDLTTRIYQNSTANLWTQTDSSLTVSLPAALPAADGYLLPYGWYHARAGANDQLSDSLLVQAGPRKPAQPVTNIISSIVSPSSATFSWTPPTGLVPGANFDGYNIYAAGSGIWIARTTNTYITITALGPGATQQISVAAYSLTGDGPLATSTRTVSVISGLIGTGLTPGSIQWSWSEDPGVGAVQYDVYNATSGAFLGSSNQPLFAQTGLSTNSIHSVQIRLANATGEGPLSDPAAAYSLAAIPLPDTSLPTAISTGSITVSWLQNGNPSGTLYETRFTSVVAGSSITAAITATGAADPMYLEVGGLEPASIYKLEVRAYNGNNVPTDWTILGTTATRTQAPLNLTITGNAPSMIRVGWDIGPVSSSATYEVTYTTASIAQFDQYASTALAFSQGFTGNTCLLSGLLTSTTYSIRVRGRNPLGLHTAYSNIVTTITFNGGDVLGTISALVPANQNTILAGTIGLLPATRAVTLRAPAGAFPSATTVLISTYDAAGGLCPNGEAAMAFSITTDPKLQPTLPLYFTVAYDPAAELVGATADRITMMRYDPISGRCVPMSTTVDLAGHTVTAQLNHLSVFQVGQWLPAATTDDVRIYPNPYNSSREPFVTIDQLPAGARVRIFTLRGELVLDQEANASGLLVWRGRNRSGRTVSSGVYLVATESGSAKKIYKLAILR
ncbi:MAG: kelch repeat-containing protein [Elusimicrobiota bacterium]|jgi:N-acetylneuraminic acid mutarotase